MTHLRARQIAAPLAAALVLSAAPGLALAHHSFAVFFSAEKDVVAVKGVVRAYRFTNPHGIIDIAVPGANGAVTNWRVETNSPSILARRGWTKDSLAVGETVTIKGWPARDGSLYMRLQSAYRASGAMIGTMGAPEPTEP